MAARTGARVEVIPDDESGQLSVDALRAMLDERVRVVSVSWIPTQGGLVNPAAAVGAVTREAGVPYLLDACQAVGQLPVDVGALGCDFLSATGRKYLRGPRGTGLLYVRRSRLAGLEPPFLDVHAARWAHGDELVVREDALALRELGAQRRQPARPRRGGRRGAAARCRRHLGAGPGAGDVVARTARDRPGLALHDTGVEQCGIVTFTIAGVDVYELAARLRTEGINISVSTIDFAALRLRGARARGGRPRASVHYYNTEDELTRLVDAITAPRA